MIQVAALARHLVRTLGVCAVMVKKFEMEAFALDLNIDECQFVGEVLDFLNEQAKKTADIGTFIGSSEILESFFGKFKSMEGDQCKEGFSGLVLAAHAHVGALDEGTVAAALSSVTTKEIKEWIKAQVGPTIQSKRKKLFSLEKQAFTNFLGQEPSEDLEGKVVGF